MTKNNQGIWELTVGPIKPGAYRYHFLLGRVPVVDPHSPSVSLSNNIAWSVVPVPGSDFMDAADVSHGAVAASSAAAKAPGRGRVREGFARDPNLSPTPFLRHRFLLHNDWRSVMIASVARVRRAVQGSLS
jgi:hypothetical protein